MPLWRFASLGASGKQTEIEGRRLSAINSRISTFHKDLAATAAGIISLTWEVSTSKVVKSHHWNFNAYFSPRSHPSPKRKDQSWAGKKFKLASRTLSSLIPPRQFVTGARRRRISLSNYQGWFWSSLNRRAGEIAPNIPNVVLWSDFPPPRAERGESGNVKLLNNVSVCVAIHGMDAPKLTLRLRDLKITVRDNS